MACSTLPNWVLQQELGEGWSQQNVFGEKVQQDLRYLGIAHSEASYGKEKVDGQASSCQSHMNSLSPALSSTTGTALQQNPEVIQIAKTKFSDETN